MRISLRLKLAMLSLILLVIPLIGFRFSAMLQAGMVTIREDTLMFTAKAVATSLGDRPNLFAEGDFESADVDSDLYLFPLSNAIRLNGEVDDWQPELSQSESFGKEQLLKARGTYDPDSLSFKHLLGERGGYVYGLFQVTDNRVVYRKKNSLDPSRGDHLQIVIEDASGTINHYILGAEKQGWINGFLLDKNPDNRIPIANEIRIQGVWKESPFGYIIEMRIPRQMLGNRLSFAVADVDNTDDFGLEYLIGTAGTASTEGSPSPGRLLAPSKRIEKLLKNLDLPNSRIRVIDESRLVRARFGKLREYSDKKDNGNSPLSHIYNLFTVAFTESFSDNSLEKTIEIEGVKEALLGNSMLTYYRLPGVDVEIMAAIAPLYRDGIVVGAVVVEQSTNSILALGNKIIEKSIDFTMVAFLLAGTVLIIFGTRISGRIRRLRNQSMAAITEDGCIHSTIEPERVGDEIGDLSRTLATMMAQLQEQNVYREKMADNLEHEMRTPLAGISASLKNLEKEANGMNKFASEYTRWALADVQRLETLLSSIRDATNLQEALQQDLLVDFDLLRGVEIWLEHGWQPSYPEVAFEIVRPPCAVNVNGDPDRLRQMIEKLIDNAVSYHSQNTPVTITVSVEKGWSIISVCNMGEAISEDMKGVIFNSMVSFRKREKGAPHLGLGLYIVRTIANHHKGRVVVENMDGNAGVCFRVMLPGKE